MIRVGGAGSAVVIGASLAGLFSAVALAGHGYEVTILERDRLPVHPEARKGVPQSAQPHVLLHRGMLAAESLLPGLRADLLAAGATCFDGGAMPWLGEYGWLDTTIGGYPVVSLTRPLLEHRVRRQVCKVGVSGSSSGSTSGVCAEPARAGWCGRRPRRCRPIWWWTPPDETLGCLTGCPSWAWPRRNLRSLTRIWGTPVGSTGRRDRSRSTSAS